MKRNSYFGVAVTLFTLSAALFSTFMIANEHSRTTFLNIDIVCADDQLYAWSSDTKEWTCEPGFSKFKPDTMEGGSI